MEEEQNESLHEIIRRNVVTATRNYNNRVQAFIREIVLDPSNPMSVEHYSAKLEFQGRGAAHDHGTLWVNMDKMEFMMEKEKECHSQDPIEYNLQDFNNLFDDSEDDKKDQIKNCLLICKNPQKFLDIKIKEAQNNLENFVEVKLIQNEATCKKVLEELELPRLANASEDLLNQSGDMFTLQISRSIEICKNIDKFKEETLKDAKWAVEKFAKEQLRKEASWIEVLDMFKSMKFCKAI